MELEPVSTLPSLMEVDNQGEGNYASTSISRDQETDQGLTLSPKIHDEIDLWRSSAADLIDDDVFEALLGPRQPDLVWERHPSRPHSALDSIPLLSELTQDCQRLCREDSAILEHGSSKDQSVSSILSKRISFDLFKTSAESGRSKRSLASLSRRCSREPSISTPGSEFPAKRPFRDVSLATRGRGRDDARTALANLSPNAQQGALEQCNTHDLNKRQHRANVELPTRGSFQASVRPRTSDVSTCDEPQTLSSTWDSDVPLPSVEWDESDFCFDLESGEPGGFGQEDNLSLPSNLQNPETTSFSVAYLQPYSNPIHIAARETLPATSEHQDTNAHRYQTSLAYLQPDATRDSFGSCDQPPSGPLASAVSSQVAQSSSSFVEVLPFAYSNEKRVAERKALEDIFHMMAKARLPATEDDSSLFVPEESRDAIPTNVERYFQELYGQYVDKTTIFESVARISKEVDLGAIFRDKKERKNLQYMDLPTLRSHLMLERTVSSLKENLLRNRVLELEKQISEAAKVGRVSEPPPPDAAYFICTKPAPRTGIPCNAVNQSYSKHKSKFTGDEPRWDKRQQCCKCRCKVTDQYSKSVDNEMGARMEKEQAKELRKERSKKRKEAAEKIDKEGLRGEMWTVANGEKRSSEDAQQNTPVVSEPQLRMIPFDWFTPGRA